MADLLWHTEDPAEVDRLSRLDSDARLVRDLMVAAAFDEHMEVTDELADYLSSL
jgi:accessory colonization factor AcfC